MTAADPRFPTLSITEYDRLDAAARISASYPALRSFAPSTFANVNFPARVGDEAEMPRYADIMYELADRKFWLNEMRWSEGEQRHMLALREEIESLTGTLFNKPIQPLMCLFPPLPIVRTIEAVAAQSRQPSLRVLEIGPGAGFLGSYLVLRGHRYVGMEVTQAFYLWNHRLLRWLTRGDFRDYAAEAPPTAWPETRASLLPWWHYAELFRFPPIDVDVVVCDAAMGEMDPFASRYVITLSKLMLERSKVGLFIYQNYGEQRQSSQDTILRLFETRGYRHFLCGGVHVQAASSASPVALLETMAAGAPAAEAGRLKSANEFLAIDEARIAESYAFFRFLRTDLG